MCRRSSPAEVISALSMANFKYPLVATRSPHPSSADYFFFDENWPPLERASFIRNDSPLVTTTIP